MVTPIVAIPAATTVSKVREHREMETRVKTMRTETRDLVKDFNKTEDDLKALQVRCAWCFRSIS